MGSRGPRPNLRAAARKQTDAAIQVLAEIMQSAASETAKVAAAKEILERGWGKVRPAAAEEGKPAKPTKEVVVFEWKIVDPKE